MTEVQGAEGVSAGKDRPNWVLAPWKAGTVEFHLDTVPMKLCGWAASTIADRANDELILSLMMGSVLLGNLRRDRPRPDVDKHLGYGGPAAGFGIADFGLAAFARVHGIDDIAIVISGSGVSKKRHQLPLDDTRVGEIDPLGIRRGLRKTVRLADLWLENDRTLNLRFDDKGKQTLWLDAYQCGPGPQQRLIKVAAERAITGPVSLATITLLNPFLPLLLVIKGEDHAVEAIDIVPFPSLARGGLHLSERLLAGHGGDDLGDTATVSAELLGALIRRTNGPTGYVTTIELDPQVHTGLEPMLNDDLLSWVGAHLGIRTRISVPEGRGKVPDFIRAALARHAPKRAKSGHSLYMPADCIPTIAALVNRLPVEAAEQTLTGGMAVVEWNRHGRIWSVWQPPLGDWLEGLQLNASRRSSPMLSVKAGARASGMVVNLDWPLALALQDRATRKAIESPFETASELELPLLRNGAMPSAAAVCVVVLFGPEGRSPLPLLESLARQLAVGPIEVIVCLPQGRDRTAVIDALSTLFPGRHVVSTQPSARGRLEQIINVRDLLAHEEVFIFDAATLLPDSRTLATLLPMLSAPDVMTAGCLLRNAQGKPSPVCAGYAPTGISLRATPAFTFGAIDPAALRQPATYPVVANSIAAMVARRSFLQDIVAFGSTSLRPEVDDVLLGIQAIERGGKNLCTSIVSAYSDSPSAGTPRLGVSLPYRLSPEVIGRIASSTTIVQKIR